MRGTTENTNHEKLTLASPLAVIARHLADKYFYRPFPVPAKGGLLDYAEIRSKPVYPIDPDAPKKLYRELHGFQNAVRTAMAIPVLFDLYRKHKDSLTPNIRGAIDSVTELWIKKVQIVALMRAAGRHHDTGKGSQFCEQAERECNHFLRQIGIGDVEADQLSKTLIYAEGPRKTKTLAASLLADAATIETFRDFAGEKKVQMAWFAFCQPGDGIAQAGGYG